MTQPDPSQPADHIREEHRVDTTEAVQETPQPVETTVTETAQTVTETSPADSE